MTEIINALPVIISLVILEGLLSVDNAMVIAAMVSHLPDKQQKWALRAGLIGAYVFRGLTLAFVTFLIANPWIKFIGAAYLVYLMFSHLGQHEEKQAGGKKGEEASDQSFWATVISVELADLAFSIDNVIAAVALSPKLWVVVVGVFIGILAMRFVAGFFVGLMKKYPILESIAYVLVGAVGIQLFAEELFHFHVSELGKLLAIGAIIASGLLYSKIRILEIMFGPLLRFLSYTMGIAARSVQMFFAPLTWLFSLILRLFKRNKSSIPADADEQPQEDDSDDDGDIIDMSGKSKSDDSIWNVKSDGEKEPDEPDELL